MKSFFSAITALALAAVVSAQGSILSVTNPINGTVFTAGKPAIISWTHPTVDIISQIVLAHGDPSNLQQDGPIASNVSAAALSYTWNIPTDIAQGVYALIFGTSPNVAYSPQFIIQPADGSKLHGIMRKKQRKIN
ncbi:hypothetical protein BX666DRAFT_1886121 [Dichotomocladium elegans]|nr:hypothetical protein BX666DRAFT_1886121 [Dichotomocladium elegans]